MRERKADPNPGKIAFVGGIGIMNKGEQTPLSAQGAEDRLKGIDFTKGALVVFMVLYHALNCSTQYHLGFRYLAFLPPSFIFITGFLIARVYFPRPPGRDGATSRRLVVRGLKLVLLFTALNVLGAVVAPRTINGQPFGPGQFFAHGFDIYVRGAGTLVAFEILLPIAYFLLLGPLLLWLHRRGASLVPAFAAATIGGIALLEFFGPGVPMNASMMAAGLLGAALGTLPRRALDALARFWPVPLLAYAVLALVAHRTGAFGQSFLVQLAAATVAVAALYALGARFRRPEWAMDRLTLLGNYSLLAYIVQIAFLQVLVRFVGRPEPDSIVFVAFFTATFLVTALSAEITHWCRARSRLADHAYRFVFA